MRPIYILAWAGLMFLVMTTCDPRSKNRQFNPDGNEIWIKNNKFDPDVLRITERAVVTWTNLDQTAHTVTSLDRLFDSKITNAERFSFRFSDAGTYEYTCKIHPQRGGVVIVE